MTFHLLAHWLHLLAAAVWVGGNLAVALVVQPALRRTLPPEARGPVFRAIGARFAVVQWTCWSVLLATGLLKLWRLSVVPGVFSSPFGAILGVKLCMIAAMVVLSLIHGKVWGPRLLAMRPGEPAYAATAVRMAFWGRVNAGLMVLIVGCAALLRFNPW